MKVLIIYSSKESGEIVSKIRKEIETEFGQQTNLRIKRYDEKVRKKLHFKHMWHHDAIQKIKSADMIVYVYSNESEFNPNVKWEIKKVLAFHKYIICLKSSSNMTLNSNSNPSDIDETSFANVTIMDFSLKVSKNLQSVFDIITNFNHDTHIALINKDYSDDNKVLMEQYKIFFNSAESLLTRRQTMNSFYLSVNTGLVTIGSGIFALMQQNIPLSRLILVLGLSIPGILMNISWRQILYSYYINNRAKLKILSMMEKHLVASSLDAEWKVMKNRYNNMQYKSFTDIEKSTPLYFIVFYIVADILAIFYFLLFCTKHSKRCNKSK